MNTENKKEIKIWLIYFGVILLSLYLHEIGHCIPAWVNGYRAIPTPMKEYMAVAIPSDLTSSVSSGGIIGTLSFTILILIAYSTGVLTKQSVLAGAIAMPGMYTLRYVLLGRGHDGTEFQETQNALGLAYDGHALDIAFLALFLIGTIVWLIRIRPGLKISGRLSAGFILTLIFVVGLQYLNNLIFDPIFNTR